MNRLLATLPLAFASCTPETTSFRTTDQSDPAETDKSAYYALRVGERGAAVVHVWSNGGYIGTSDEPMTHVGFDIENRGAVPIVFDVDALRLSIAGKHVARLPPPRFVAVTPLGPAKVPIDPGTSALLDSYYELAVRPRSVDTMQIRWTLRAGPASVEQVTTFVRDDDAPVIE